LCVLFCIILFVKFPLGGRELITHQKTVCVYPDLIRECTKAFPDPENGNAIDLKATRINLICQTSAIQGRFLKQQMDDAHPLVRYRMTKSLKVLREQLGRNIFLLGHSIRL
jgi:hypothetical protein